MPRFDRSRTAPTRVVWTKQRLDDRDIASWCKEMEPKFSHGGAYLDVIDFSGNSLTSAGVEVLVDFLSRNQVRVKALKLYMNPLGPAAADSIVELLADDRIGIQGGLAEVHLSHTGLDEEGLWKILEVAWKKKPWPPLWLRVEHNKMDAQLVVERANQFGLKTCWFHQGYCKQFYCPYNAHVHLFAGWSQKNMPSEFTHMLELPAPDRPLPICDKDGAWEQDGSWEQGTAPGEEVCADALSPEEAIDLKELIEFMDAAAVKGPGERVVPSWPQPAAAADAAPDDGADDAWLCWGPAALQEASRKSA